ncbi:MAG: 50S ribosomal protein L35 [Gemmatimonadaceae bacterium]
MPKMKSHSGAKKRFKVTASGKVKRRGAYHTHILTKKDPKRKRRLRRQAIIKTRGEAKTLKRLLQA